MAINRTSPKKGKVVDIPDATITIGTPTAGNAQVSIAFTVATTPATGGPVQKYTAVSTPGSVTVSGSTSPIVVTGLTNDTAYTIQVAAANTTGRGPLSAASASATPLDPAGFVSIATTTVGVGGASSISFTSIPQTYKHLQIRGIARTNDAGQTQDIIGLRINSDTTTANYVSHRIAADGTNKVGATQASGTYSSSWAGYATGVLGVANVFGATIIDLLDYTSTVKNKVGRTLAGDSQNNTTDNQIILGSTLYISTNAVTTITLVPIFASGFVQYTSFALYGIKG
jgi:hypothetical protein